MGRKRLARSGLPLEPPLLPTPPEAALELDGCFDRQRVGCGPVHIIGWLRWLKTIIYNPRNIYIAYSTRVLQISA